MFLTAETAQLVRTPGRVARRGSRRAGGRGGALVVRADRFAALPLLAGVVVTVHVVGVVQQNIPKRAGGVTAVPRLRDAAPASFFAFCADGNSSAMPRWRG